MRSKKNWVETVIFAVVVLLVILALTSNIWLQYTTVTTVDATVTNTDRISTGSGESLSHKYLVFTKNETFENTDAILFWKFDSSDVQGHLEKGKTYRFKVNGYRVPWMSWYRNILEVEEIPQ